MYSDEDSEAGDADANGDESEEEAVLGEIGEVGDDHGKAEGSSPGWNRMN